MSERTDSQIIAEAMGLCKHKRKPWSSICMHCGIAVTAIDGVIIDSFHPSTDPTAYLEAMAWAKKRKWWGDFLVHVRMGIYNCDLIDAVVDIFLDPKQGSHALASYIEGRETPKE